MHMLSDCSSRSFPILFFKEKAVQLSDRTNPLTSNGHLCKSKLVPFYMFTPPTPSPVAEAGGTVHLTRQGGFPVCAKNSITTDISASFYAESGGTVVQTSCTYGNYHTQTLASFTGIPKVLSPLQGLFSYFSLYLLPPILTPKLFKAIYHFFHFSFR